MAHRLNASQLTLGLRADFDYQHGGFYSPEDAAETLAWLQLAGIHANHESSGDLFRIWCPAVEAYFWPENASAERWNSAV